VDRAQEGDQRMSETKTRIVTIGSVQTKSGESGEGDSKRKWRRYSLIDPDDKFVGSTFSGTIGKFLQDHEGQRVEVDIEEKPGREGGTLRDLLDAREPGAGTAAPAGAVNDDAVVAALNRIAIVLEKLAEREAKTFDPETIPF